MDVDTTVQGMVIALVGGTVSYLMAQRKLSRLRRRWMIRHMESMTALADAAVEVMAVDYGADLKDCMHKLFAKAKELNPGLVGLGEPQLTKDAEEKIEKLRKERNGDKKPD